MDKKPFTFEESNKRLVADVEYPSSTYWVAGTIFLASLYMYRRRVYRLDNNFMKFAIFTGIAPWCSY